MSGLIHERCFNHSLREAAARCPNCGHFYCRECITDHDDHVICAACLRKVVTPALTQRRVLVGLLRTVQCLVGLFITWLFFHLAGLSLLSIDPAFHEGTVWKGRWLDQE